MDKKYNDFDNCCRLRKKLMATAHTKKQEMSLKKHEKFGDNIQTTYICRIKI